MQQVKDDPTGEPETLEARIAREVQAELARVVDASDILRPIFRKAGDEDPTAYGWTPPPAPAPAPDLAALQARAVRLEDLRALAVRHGVRQGAEVDFLGRFERDQAATTSADPTAPHASDEEMVRLMMHEAPHLFRPKANGKADPW